MIFSLCASKVTEKAKITLNKPLDFFPVRYVPVDLYKISSLILKYN